jgi:hypothetical protein
MRKSKEFVVMRASEQSSPHAQKASFCGDGHLSPKALYLALGPDLQLFWPTETITAPYSGASQFMESGGLGQISRNHTSLLWLLVCNVIATSDQIDAKRRLSNTE